MRSDIFTHFKRFTDVFEKALNEWDRIKSENPLPPIHDPGANNPSGVDFGHPPFPPGYSPFPTPFDLRGAIDKHANDKKATEEREKILDPNRGSSTKVERYTFPLTTHKLIPSKEERFEVRGQPTVTFRPQQLLINIPKAGILFVEYILIANVNVMIGTSLPLRPDDPLEDHLEDAFSYHLDNNHPLDLPTMSPANTCKIGFRYTGDVLPSSMNVPHLLTTTFRGPATIIA